MKRCYGFFRMLVLAVCPVTLLVCLNLALPAFSADLIFVGDFETGDLSQYRSKVTGLAGTVGGTVQEGNFSKAEIVTDVVRSGKYAARFTVFSGVKPSSNATVRAEMVANPTVRFLWDGPEYWLGFSFLFNEWDADGHTFYQLHSPNEPEGSPCDWEGNTFTVHPTGATAADPVDRMLTISLIERGGQVRGRSATTGSTAVYSVPMDVHFGVWQDFVVRLKLSTKGDGYYEVWKDGWLVYSQFGLTTVNYIDSCGGPVPVPYHNGPHIGIYSPSEPRFRQMYYDEVRVAQGEDGYLTVAPPKPFHLIKKGLIPGGTMSGPIAVSVEFLGGKPKAVHEVRVQLGGEEIYRGPDAPADLRFNEGELSDGWHTLVIETIGAGGEVLTSEATRFEVRNIKLAADSRAGGLFPVSLETSLPPEAVRNVRITASDVVLYENARLEKDIRIDTRLLPDGRHKLVAEIVTNQGAVSQAEATVNVFNWWVLRDELLPPLQTALFGARDRSKTLSRSEGWRYATDDRAAFLGADSRMAPTSGDPEWMVWETDQLSRATVVLFAKADDVPVEAVALSVSGDGTTWREIPYEIVYGEVSDAGWRQVTLTGVVPTGMEANYFRLEVRRHALNPADVQLDMVELTGLERWARED